MQIHPCAFDGWQLPGVPRVYLVQGLNAMDRELARTQARAALRDCLAMALHCVPCELEISNLRNQAPQVRRNGVPLTELYCSVSHAPGSALLAWCQRGPIGVDIQVVETFASRSDLAAVAELYFAKKCADVLMRHASDALFFDEFARAWATHEACLKCAERGLAEWNDALALSLQGIRHAELVLSDVMGGYKGAVAWRG